MKHCKTNCLATTHITGEVLQPRRTARLQPRLRFSHRYVIYVDNYVRINGLDISAQTEAHLMTGCAVGWSQVDGLTHSQLQRTVKVPNLLALIFLHSHANCFHLTVIRQHACNRYIAATQTILYPTKHLYRFLSVFHVTDINTLPIGNPKYSTECSPNIANCHWSGPRCNLQIHDEATGISRSAIPGNVSLENSRGNSGNFAPFCIKFFIYYNFEFWEVFVPVQCKT